MRLFRAQALYWEWNTMTEEYVRSVLSGNLRKLRNRRKWSQTELAQKANISMNFLSGIERGRKWPYPKTLQNLAVALEVDVFEFFRPKEEETPDIEEYMNRFSNDMVIAVEKSVKNTVSTVTQQYRKKLL
jgi:transcriptional regulator with XRE-family HTH domain